MDTSGLSLATRETQKSLLFCRIRGTVNLEANRSAVPLRTLRRANTREAGAGRAVPTAGLGKGARDRQGQVSAQRGALRSPSTLEKKVLLSQGTPGGNEGKAPLPSLRRLVSGASRAEWRSSCLLFLTGRLRGPAGRWNSAAQTAGGLGLAAARRCHS